VARVRVLFSLSFSIRFLCVVRGGKEELRPDHNSNIVGQKLRARAHIFAVVANIRNRVIVRYGKRKRLWSMFEL